MTHNTTKCHLVIIRILGVLPNNAIWDLSNRLSSIAIMVDQNRELVQVPAAGKWKLLSVTEVMRVLVCV